MQNTNKDTQVIHQVWYTLYSAFLLAECLPRYGVLSKTKCDTFTSKYICLARAFNLVSTFFFLTFFLTFSFSCPWKQNHIPRRKDKNAMFGRKKKKGGKPFSMPLATISFSFIEYFFNKCRNSFVSYIRILFTIFGL